MLEEVAYADDEAIITEGDAGDNLYIIEEGSCVATKTVDGESVVVKEYAVGDFFGELALLTDQPRAATGALPSPSPPPPPPRRSWLLVHPACG